MKIPAALPLCLVGLVTWAAFFMMDKYWYHRLLKGAVDQGLFVETRLMPYLPRGWANKEVRRAKRGEDIWRQAAKR